MSMDVRGHPPPPPRTAVPHNSIITMPTAFSPAPTTLLDHHQPKHKAPNSAVVANTYTAVPRPLRIFAARGLFTKFVFPCFLLR